ncbi:MAG TPA: aminotransferase class III-fold pyridoxal phosphate-dependent enzyme [Gemmataceae bacterium]|jgi:acetylornithine/succinyldiaminopimelate/putrescine aminotransferase
MNSPGPLAATCELILAEQIPNFFRLCLNPYVVQTCYCLSRYVQTAWPSHPDASAPCQSFLANSLTEAVSGAIKLVRFNARARQRSSAGLILDTDGRLPHFAFLSLANGERIELIPGLTVAQSPDELAGACASGESFGFVVLMATPSVELDRYRETLQQLLRKQSPWIIACVDRSALHALGQGSVGLAGEQAPDVVVFDESFVNRELPFAAFTARKDLFVSWNQPGMSTFHSTTFQPNTISTLHFLNCLRQTDPAFHAAERPVLERIRHDPTYCLSLLAELYSPCLAKTIRTLGFDTLNARATGHSVDVGGRELFDGVAGVACSIRGHNPPSYLAEIQSGPADDELVPALSLRLKARTGLACLLPAVSGASAAENALRIGLAAQHPRKYVLAFKGGFGGKTLLALTGTARASYKENLDPLYEHVLYLDPFAPTVLEDLERSLRDYPVAIVQLELIQAVGGVRPLPLRLLRYLQEQQQRWGYLLFVDEVQTGMYRTGPFYLSEKMSVAPDLLTLGKGTSDMMIPFSLTLYSTAIQRRLEEVCPALAEDLRRRAHYPAAYRSMLNTLNRAEKIGLEEQVARLGALFSRLLSEQLSGCRAVQEVRVHGLLIGIELRTKGLARRWLKKRIASLYLLNMLRHASFPVLVGYCQYEPNVLKLTPPLSIAPEEAAQVCQTIGSALREPLFKFLPRTLAALVGSSFRRLRGRSS